MTQATELRELASLIRVNNGNVGIGPLTADPPYTLSLGQTNVAGAQTIRLAGNGNPKHEIQFREAGVGYGFTFRYAGDATDNKLHIVQHENSTNGTEIMTFKRDSMEVGIGTDSPDLLYEGLHIKSANPSLKIEGTGTSSWEFIHLKQPNYDRLIGMRTTGSIVINSGTNLDANNMLVIDTAGKVGVNVENPVHDLDVNGAIATRQVRHSIRPTLNLDFANSKELDPRITFYRDSIATYYDSKGVLRYSNVNEPRFDHDPATGESKGLLIEEARSNLTDKNNRFNDWFGKNRVDFIANAAKSPDGYYNATKVIDAPNGINARHEFWRSFSAVSGTTYTFSIYAKAEEHTMFNFVWYGDNGVFGGETYFDLDAETITLGPATRGSITHVGDGWYRCEASRVSGATASGYYGIYMVEESTGSSTYVGISDGGLYFFGAQFEVGAFPTSYVPSDTRFTSRSSVATYYDENGILRTAPANSARYGYKYDGRKWVETGLILESASTNYFTESNFFEGSSWSIGRQNISISKDSTGNPDGNTNTRFMTANSESGAWILKNVNLSSGTFYTTSVYAKQKSSGINVQIAPSTGFSPTYQNFNLSTGELGSGNLSNDQRATMEDVGNGWYRCSVTGQANLSLGRMAIAMTNGDLARLQSVPNGSMLYIFGTQMEANHGPTSFIYADSATKTRSADVASSVAYTRGNDIAEMLNVEYDIPQPVGTIYSEWSTSEPTGGFGGVFEIRDSGSNGIDHRFTSSNVQYYITDNTSINTGGAHTPNTFTKTSLAYDFDSNLDSRSARDGSLQSVNTSNIFNLHLKDIRFGSIDFNPAYQLNGHLKSFRLYPKRMTDGEIQALTENN